MLQISLQPSPRLKRFEQNWELLISHQFYRRFSSGLPETSVVIKKVTRTLSVHCMLFNIQVAIPRKYSIHWTNTVDSFIKRQDVPIAVKNFLIFCLLPWFYFGMGLLVPVILTCRMQNHSANQTRSKEPPLPTPGQLGGAARQFHRIQPTFSFITGLSTADSTWP